MAFKPYTITKEIFGKTYKAQFCGVSVALDAVDQSYIDGTQNTSVKKLAEFLFDNVFVEPTKLSIDDFDNIEEFNEVVTFGRKVMQGELKNEANTKS